VLLLSRRLKMLFPVGLLLFGCGGSSSETPPPLEPLPVNLHYDRASTALSTDQQIAEVDAGGVQRADEAEEQGADSSAPARSTWGSDRPAPAPLK
jgi:hypothetical protein